MVKPAEKAPQIVRFLDTVAMALYGRSRTESIKKDICVSCGKSATEFHTDASWREYTISGLCQECQNEEFGVPDDSEPFDVL